VWASLVVADCRLSANSVLTRGLVRAGAMPAAVMPDWFGPVIFESGMVVLTLTVLFTLWWLLK